jgi:hypothetical protein
LVLKIDWNWIHQKNATLCIEIWQLQYIASYSRKCCCYNIVRHTWGIPFGFNLLWSMLWLRI